MVASSIVKSSSEISYIPIQWVEMAKQRQNKCERFSGTDRRMRKIGTGELNKEYHQAWEGPWRRTKWATAEIS